VHTPGLQLLHTHTLMEGYSTGMGSDTRAVHYPVQRLAEPLFTITKK